MSVNMRKAESLFAFINNEVERFGRHVNLSVEERMAREVLLTAIAAGFNAFDKLNGNEHISRQVEGAIAAFPIEMEKELDATISKATNHIALDKHMLSDLLVAINQKTVADERIHLIDNGGILIAMAERAADKLTYELIQLPSLITHNK